MERIACVVIPALLFAKLTDECGHRFGEFEKGAGLIGEAVLKEVSEVSWWVVLYALSMLARYAPSKWTETLSLSDSGIASRVEFLLDAAVGAVPEIFWNELSRL